MSSASDLEVHVSEPALVVTDVDVQPQGHCRYGLPGDRFHFVRLWRELATVLYEFGCGILPNEHNLYLYRDFFDAYTTGRLDGVVVFWSPTPDSDPAGVAMAGDSYPTGQWEVDQKDERWGVLWGVYVQPAYRGAKAGLQMEELGRQRLLAKGFHCLTTSVRADNPLGKANWKQLDDLHDTKLLEYTVLGRLEER